MPSNSSANVLDRPIRLLVVGGDGLIGSSLTSRLLQECVDVTSSTRRLEAVASKRPYINLADKESFVNIDPSDYEVAIFCSAITSVKACEENASLTWAINVEATFALARLLCAAGTHVVFLSSNMVFDGSKPFANPDDYPCPTTEYGRQKATAEELLLSLSPRPTIIRFSKIIQPHHPLFTGWLHTLLAGNKIHPFSDKRLSPVSLRYANDVLTWIAFNQLNGILHVSANADISYFEAASHLAHLLHVDPLLIEAISCQSNNKSIKSQPLFTTLSMPEPLFPNFTPPCPKQAFVDLVEKNSPNDSITRTSSPIY